LRSRLFWQAKAAQDWSRAWAGTLTAMNNSTGPSGEPQRLRLHAERLDVSTTPDTPGLATVGTTVEETRVVFDMPYVYETLDVQTQAVQIQAQRSAEPIAGPQHLTVQLSREIVSVRKRTVVAEEVGLGRRTETDIAHVSVGLRREVLKVEGDSQ